MKMITLRFLLCEPLKVKRLTRAGQSITVTDNGSPLCVIRPKEKNPPARRSVATKAIGEFLDEAFLEKPARIFPINGKIG